MPITYHLPAALILLAGGLLACFAGYRLFRLVLGIYGFVLGAFLALSFVSTGNATTMLVAALVGGLVGALVLTLGYFVGVALVGGGLGAMVAHAVYAQQGWGDPRTLPLLAFAVVGAILAHIFQRYVIVVATAFGGSWVALVGGMAMAGDTAARRLAEKPDIWRLYPFHAPTSGTWVTYAWLALGILGLAVQLRAGARRA